MAISYRKRTSTRAGKKKTSWTVTIRLRGRKSTSKTFPRKDDARAWAVDEQKRLCEGRRSRDHKFSVADGIDTWLDANPDASTQRLRALDRWREQIGAMRLAALEAADIVEARKAIAATPFPSGKRKGALPSNPTLNRYKSYLSAVLRECVEAGMIAVNPCKQVRQLPDSAVRDRFLERDEIEALLAACKESAQPALYPLVLAALITGARAGELIGLKWSDVNLDRRTATLRKTKNKQPRLLHMQSDSLVQALTRLRARTITSLHGYVFTTSTGEQFTDYGRPFKRACERAGIEGLRFHDLRHTTASMLAQQGRSLLEIGRVLGHQSPQATARYAHLTTADAADNVAGMAAEFGLN